MAMRQVPKYEVPDIDIKYLLTADTQRLARNPAVVVKVPIVELPFPLLGEHMRHREPLGSENVSMLNSYMKVASALVDYMPTFVYENKLSRSLGLPRKSLHDLKAIASRLSDPVYVRNPEKLEQLLKQELVKSSLIESATAAGYTKQEIREFTRF